MSALRDVAEEVVAQYDRQISALGLDPKGVAEKGLIQDTKKVIQNISEEFKTYDKKNPEALFAACFRGLDKIEQKRFVLMNILEKLKQHSQPLNQIVGHFNGIGLTNIEVGDPEPPAQNPPEPRGRSGLRPPTRTGLPRPLTRSDLAPARLPQRPPDEEADARKPSWLVRTLMHALRKCAETLISASIKIAKIVFGQFMKAIKPNIGFSGPWPTITWQIETEAFEYETLKVLVEKFQALQSADAPDATEA